MQEQMIRYGRNEDGSPRSTLATLRQNNTIYFGIARCCSKDTFSKKLGRMIALNRAMKERDTFSKIVKGKDENAVVDMMFASNGLRGMCNVQQVKDLLDHFRTL